MHILVDVSFRYYTAALNHVLINNSVAFSELYIMLNTDLCYRYVLFHPLIIINKVLV